MIKEFFANYFLHTADVTIDLGENAVEVHHARSEPWRITLVDTGAETQTGGRLKTNVMGTVHVMGGAAGRRRPHAGLHHHRQMLRESRMGLTLSRDRSMGGYGPYSSSSKGAAELAIAAYRRSYSAAECGTLLPSCVQET